MGDRRLGAVVCATFIVAFVEFATIYAYDAVTGNLDFLNLALNSLSFSKVGKVASTDVKMTKSLKLAKQIGMKAREVKNYIDLLNFLAGKKIFLKQTNFDF